MDRLSRIAIGSIAISIAVLGSKTLAWALTGSTALFSDALESIVNVATALIALAAIRFSALPPDTNHPYGHSKIELFAAFAEGAMIVTAAVLILQHAVADLRHPAPLRSPLLGIAVNAIGSVLNATWSSMLLREGKQHHSPALLADGRHLATDVLTSAGLVIGLAAALLTGIKLLDPLLAACVAIYILWAGYSLARENAAGLMDEAPTPDVLARIETLLADNGAGALQAHDIRTRLAGQRTFLQFHLVVPGGMTVDEAHVICDRIEAGIAAHLPQVVTTIHVEPEGKAHATGALPL